jgi:hypothetical protein
MILIFSLILMVLPLFVTTSCAKQDTIQNNGGWTGYIRQSNNDSITNISGEWTVQPALGSPTPRASAQWIGIGTGSPIQIGTTSCWNVTMIGCNNSDGASYGAWFMLVQPIWWPWSYKGYQWSSLKVRAGDNISANIQFNRTCNCWDARISDNGGTLYVDNSTAAGYVQNNSAEWIDERPGAGSKYDITNFIVAHFRNATVKNGRNEENLLPTQTTYINESPGDNLNTSLISETAFDVLNFRIENITVTSPINFPSNHTIVSGQSAHFYTTAYGGTGAYNFTLKLVNGPSSQDYSINCSRNTWQWNTWPLNTWNTNVASCYFNTNQNTAEGNYSFMFQVHAVGGPANETITTPPINITVQPSTTITLYNSQPSPTPVPFQQLIAIDSAEYPMINANWSNVEFTINAPYANALGANAIDETQATNSSAP